MLKKLAVCVAGLMLMVSVLCGCGNSLEGTWYKVCADPASNTSIQISSDSISGDMATSYTVDGDQVTIQYANGLATQTFTVEDVDGGQGLFEPGSNHPYYVNSLEGAQQAYEDQQ